MTPLSRRSVPGQTATRPLILSAIWPGLGHLYLGHRREAGWLGIPPAILLVPLLVAGLHGLDGLIGFLIVPRNSLLVILALLVSLVTRVLAIIDIQVRFRPKGSTQNRRLAPGLIVAVIAIHLLSVYGASSLYGFSSRVFGSDGNPTSSQAPQASSDIGTLPSPFETPAPNNRMTVLLVGSDSGTGYQHSLTDTMLVVSVDRETHKVTMISVPRDLSAVPMYSGGTYDPKLNSLLTKAASDPTNFPDGGPGTLAREIGYIIGVPVHYIAYVNLAGFAKLIDIVGGVDINVTTAIDDPGFEFDDGARGFHLAVGIHHLNSRLATAYVRSRYGPGNNDFERARRQQELLLALRLKLSDPTVLPHLPELLDGLSRIIATNFPADLVGDVLSLSKQIPSENVVHYVLGPPLAMRSPTTTVYSLIPDLPAIAKWSRQVFGSDSRYASAPPSPSPSPSPTP